MRVVALAESADHVCARYRLAAFAPALAAAGHSLDIRPLPAAVFARLRLYRSLRAADVVVLQRKLPAQAELAFLRRYARRLVFDFDDAVWLRDSYSPKGVRSGRRQRRFRAVMAACDAVVAGNPYLAAEADRWVLGGRVAVVPTCVDPDRYPLAFHRRTAGVRLAWVGSASTLRGLDRFRGTLDAVGRAVPGLRLTLICDKFLTLADLPVDPVPWSEGTEAAELAAADVGISWVPDDPWSRGKCGLKVLQYQAAGLPVVANPVGAQADLVADGVSGFLADGPAEWAEAVFALAHNPALRRNFGRHGRRAVEAGYSVAAGGRRWVELLDRLAAGPARAAG